MDYQDRCFGMYSLNRLFNSDHLDDSESTPFDPPGCLLSRTNESNWKNSGYSEQLHPDDFYQRKYRLRHPSKNCFNRRKKYDQNFLESTRITSKHLFPKKVDTDWKLLKESTCSISKPVTFEDKFPFGRPKFSFPRFPIVEPPTQLRGFGVSNDELVFSKKENASRTHIHNPFLPKNSNFSVVSGLSDEFPFPLHTIPKTFGTDWKACDIASAEMDRFPSDGDRLSPLVAQLHDITNKLASCISDENQLNFQDRNILQMVINILKSFAFDSHDDLSNAKAADFPNTETQSEDSGKSVDHMQDRSDTEELSQEKASWLDANYDSANYEGFCVENTEVKYHDTEDYYYDKRDSNEMRRQNDTQDYNVDGKEEDKESEGSLLFSNASSFTASNDENNEDIDEVIYKGRQQKEAYQNDQSH